MPDTVTTPILVLIYAASLAAAFVAWYFCLLIPNRWARGLLRAAFVGVLCAPGVLIGHGVAPAPMLFALYAQPFIFNFALISFAWIVASAIILGVPALRNDPGRWPPSTSPSRPASTRWCSTWSVGAGCRIGSSPATSWAFVPGGSPP